MKRTLTTLLALLLALTMFFSFANAEGLEMSDIPGMTAPGVLPIVTEETQLTIAYPQHTLTLDFDDNDLTKYVEEQTGIDIVWELLPNAETATVIDLRLSSGEKLGDILAYNLGSTGASSYGSQGYFQPLNEYFDKYSYFLYDALYEDELAEYMTRLKEADGNIYGYSYYSNSPGDQIKVCAYINMQWLNKLGLSKPTNLDELRDVLIAFRDNDMNGNGDLTDEFPMITSGGAWNGGYEQFIINNFIYYDPDYVLNVEDNVVYAPFATTEWQDAMIYLNGLVKDKLFDPISLTMTREEYAQMLEAQTLEEQVAGVITGSTAHIMVDKSNPYLLSYDYLDPFEGQYTPNRLAQMTPNFFIMEDCEIPEIAFRFFDFFAQPRVSVWMRYGVPGDTVTWRADDPDAFDAKYPNASQRAYNMGLEPVYATDFTQKKDPWSNENNSIWNIYFCGMLPIHTFTASATETPASEFLSNWDDSFAKGDITDHSSYVNAFMVSWIGKHPDQMFIEPKYTVEEMDQYNDTINTVKTYYKEWLASFVTGAKDPVNDWDEYMAGLETSGLNDWLTVAQAYWDRANG